LNHEDTKDTKKRVGASGSQRLLGSPFCFSGGSSSEVFLFAVLQFEGKSIPKTAATGGRLLQ
jgi:hypothetical protein